MVKTDFSPKSRVQSNGALPLPKLVRDKSGIETGDIIIFKTCEVKKAHNGNNLICLEMEKVK